MIRSTFLGLQIGLRGLLGARGGLDTTGHNITNSSTPGYSRQRVNLRSAYPLAFPGPFFTLRPGQIGTGVDIVSIERIRSQYIEAQIHSENGNRNMLLQMSETFARIENLLGEPSNSAINGLMGQLFDAWEELSNDPESRATRTQLREAAEQLTGFVNELDAGIKRELDDINLQLRGKVTELNGLAEQVAELNRQIIAVEGDGSNPALQANDLKDRRDLLIEQISSIVNARVLFTADGGTTVLIQGHPLVQNGRASTVGVRPDPADPFRPVIEFTASRIPLGISGGELHGLIRMRDSEIPAVQREAAQLISALTNRVNRIHLAGYGLDGVKGRAFFTDTETRRVLGQTSLPSTTTLDTTLDQLGISAGDFFVQGQRIEIRSFEVLPGQAISLRQLIERIETVAPDIRLELDTTSGFTRLKIGQWNPVQATDPLLLDSGSSNFFEAFGIQSANIQVLEFEPPYQNALYNFRLNPALAANLDAIAAAGDDGTGYPGPGDNRTALSIADLRNKSNAVQGSSFQEFYQSTIARLGNRALEAESAFNTSTLVLEQLDAKRQEISGVNLDEEAVNLIRYQKAFEASSRAITAADEVLETIIFRMGIVGR